VWIGRGGWSGGLERFRCDVVEAPAIVPLARLPLQAHFLGNDGSVKLAEAVRQPAASISSLAAAPFGRWSNYGPFRGVCSFLPQLISN